MDLALGKLSQSCTYDAKLPRPETRRQATNGDRRFSHLLCPTMMTMTHWRAQAQHSRVQASFCRNHLIFDFARCSCFFVVALRKLWPRPWLAGPFAPHKKGSGRWALGVVITQPAGFRELREVRPAAGSRRSIRSQNLRSLRVARRGPVKG